MGVHSGDNTNYVDLEVPNPFTTTVAMDYHYNPVWNKNSLKDLLMNSGRVRRSLEKVCVTKTVRIED